MFNQRLTNSRFNNHRIKTEPQSNNTSVVNSRNSFYAQNRRNSLSLFQNQLNNYIFYSNKQKLKMQRKNQRSLRKKTQIEKQIQLNQVKDTINYLKRNVQIYKKTIEINDRINQLVDNQASQKLFQKQKKPNLPAIFKHQNIHPPPIHNLAPLLKPPPFFYPPPPSFQYKNQRSKHKKQRQQTESQMEEENQRITPVKPKKNLKNNKLKMKKADKQKLRKKLRLILKAAFLAVSYYFILKNLTKKIIAKRRTIFSKFWPHNFLKSTNAMRKWFSNGCKPFFDQMIKKSQVQIQIDGDQSQPVLNQKKKAIKILINLFIKCVQKLINHKSFDQIAQILHIFCKHGAFIDNGVLTPQQLQVVSISEANGYLLMDTNLQKSQILNFLFLKVITFNLLLQPWKYDQTALNISQNTTGYQNFYYISSVFYQIILHIQDKILQATNSNLTQIKIGNWSQMKSKVKIKCSPSLCHLQNNYQKGQFISGLVNQNIIKQYLPIGFWSQEIQLLENIVNITHNKIRKVHAKLINQVYQYKDISKFQVNNK